MKEKMKGGYLVHHVGLLNGRTYQKILKKQPSAQFRSEQSKILSSLWNYENECMTFTDLSQKTGLAINTLTSMIKKLEEQGLVSLEACKIDKRKRYVSLTELGKAQKEIGDEVSYELGEQFYKGFSTQEIFEFESYLERIIQNLKEYEE
ncbi:MULTISPECIES: MarR family winged helix-turn-helix transcriptional regulator [unclassified Granulicatella]|jgi:transcriptional regulator, MarR family|uniref:MarR family winged helix-turn-helix transcriptional regulator n=1 Tax=unclassified Granulicatella TaxID=2630493 RepID=UPI00066E058D|nr:MULTISPECIES: MarR family transcriptional regulator [unclassified Granulicatella]